MNKREREVTLGVCVSLAACQTFLQYQAEQWVFDPEDPQLQALWNEQGRALAELATFASVEELIKQVAVAWPVTIATGGNCGLLLPAGAAVFFTQSAQPIVFGEAGEEEEETVPLVQRPPTALVPVEYKAALSVADTLPSGMLWVWAQDMTVDGSKRYFVGSLDDFWHHYVGLLARSHRVFYEIIRWSRCCFFADLEYSLEYKENQARDPLAMLALFKELVESLWKEETRHDCGAWIVSTSSKAGVKVSYHALNEMMGFLNPGIVHAFAKRLEARAPKELFVTKKVWNAHLQCHELRHDVFFMDLSVYSEGREGKGKGRGREGKEGKG